ncbi:MAG: pyridoxal phosphate-dependent aminotransferase, partial [Phascolarctobacterium sp.]|nr:pyridoxal phosphate-dependent aminotransferase [Candidatus Phascolarctobacterium caballi]
VDDAEKFAVWMLQSFDVDGETMMFAPGNGFNGNPMFGKQEARLAYVINCEELARAIYILGEGLKKYPGRLQEEM